MACVCPTVYRQVKVFELFELALTKFSGGQHFKSCSNPENEQD